MKTWTTYRTARTPRRCGTRTHACRGIAAGDRYSYSSLPPGSDLGNTTWLHLNECEACATTCGRPFPTTPTAVTA